MVCALTLGLSLGAVGLAPAAGAPAAGVPAAAPVVRSQGARTTASMLVPVPVDRAWAVLTRYESTGQAMPDIKLARVLRRDGRRLELQHVYQAPYTFGLRIGALLELQETPKTEIRYRLLRGDRIRNLRGSWTLTPVPGGTLVRHQISLEPEIPELLRPAFRELSDANLRESMAILRQLMLKG